MPVDQTTEKQVQGVANTQKRRPRNGPSSCETDRTEQRGSQLSAPKWDGYLVSGKAKVLVLIYSQFTQTSTRLVTIDAPFKYPLRADVQQEKPKGKVNLWDSSHYTVRLNHGL